MSPFAKKWKSPNLRLTVTYGFRMALFAMMTNQTCLAQSAGNKAAAEALFDQGRQLVQSGDYAQACQKFEASQKLDEGIGTLLYLADCYEKIGRTASAWATFKEAASIAGAQGQSSRQKLANQRAQGLESGLVKVVIDVAKGNEGLLGFEVRNDGVPIPTAQFGIPVPIDPGEHHIEASAPGKQSYVDVVRISKGVGHVSVPQLTDLAPSKPASLLAPREPGQENSNVGGVVANPTAPKSTFESDTTTGKAQRITAYVVGGLGVVGVGVGTYFGLAAIHDNNQSKTRCSSNDGGACYGGRLSQYNDAVREARVSTVAFIAGGALLATGVVLYFTTPERKTVSWRTGASVGQSSVQWNIGGEW